MRKFEKISISQWEMDTNDYVAPDYLDIDQEDYDDSGSYYNIKLPRRATSKSAGYDIYTPVGFKVAPHCSVRIPTGLKVDMNDNEVFLLFIRSSLGLKHNITLTNNVGVIDADYYNNSTNEGHFWVCLTNNSDTEFVAEVGDRIAQGVFISYNIVVDDDPIMKNRNGGFGSTNE